MKCDEIRASLPDYIQGSLEEGEAPVKKHLSSCASCRKEFESLESVWTKLEKLPVDQPAEVVRERFYSMLAAYQEGLSHSRQIPRMRDVLNSWIERWWPKKPAIQMGLAAALLFLGFLAGFRITTDGPSNSEMTYLRQEIQSMREMMTLSLLRQESASDRLRGVTYGAKLSSPDDEIISALLSTLNTDPNTNVRLAAIEALFLFSRIPEVKSGLIQSIALQNTPIVQIELINLLVELREKAAIETFRALVNDDGINEVVREKAQWGIDQLS